jgi:hypothetical protein
LFAVVGFLDYINYPNVNIVNSSSELILFWTFLAIIIYSLETYRLRDETYRLAEESIKQNRMAIYPILMIYPEIVHLANGKLDIKSLIVRNIGKGIALLPKIDTQNIREDEGYNYYYEYKIKEQLILPNEKADVIVEFVKMQKKKKEGVPIMGISDGPMPDFYKHEYCQENKSFGLTIRYKDIEMGQHHSEVKINPNEKKAVLLNVG